MIGGLFKSYDEYLQSDMWEAKRKTFMRIRNPQIFELFKKVKCEKCKEIIRAVSAQVHHLSYAHVTNEKMSDLMILCYKCHREAHSKGEE